MMEYANIPDTGLRSSRIGLGTWAIGGWMWGGTDEERSIQTICAALDRGITLIDTAPAYGHGRSEEIVASLRLLGTDYVDVYQVHWPDPLVPLDETAEAMHQLYERGLILAIGVSNFSPAQMAAFRSVAPLHTAQPPYNLFEREAEEEVLPHCRRHGIATLTYGALCRGLLSGRMRPDTLFEGDDLRRTDPKFVAPRYTQYLRAVATLERLARESYGKSVLALAVRWVLDQPGVQVALWGARTPEQLAPLDEVMGWSLDAEGKRAIDAIVRESVSDPVGPEFMAPPARALRAPEQRLHDTTGGATS